MIKSIIFILIASLLTISCSTEDPTESVSGSDDSINIHFGSFGGLCGYNDSLSVFSSLETHFDLKTLCPETDFETQQSMTQLEYDALLNSFSMSEFKSIDLNSCARCVDGTDNFLFIESPDYSHRIVFERRDDIGLIQELVDQLEKIREAHMP